MIICNRYFSFACHCIDSAQPKWFLFIYYWDSLIIFFFSCQSAYFKEYSIRCLAIFRQAVRFGLSRADLIIAKHFFASLQSRFIICILARLLGEHNRKKGIIEYNVYGCTLEYARYILATQQTLGRVLKGDQFGKKLFFWLCWRMETEYWN